MQYDSLNRACVSLPVRFEEHGECPNVTVELCIKDDF